MSGILRKIKILIILAFILAVVGGGYYLLLYLNVVRTPDYLLNAPILGDYVAQGMEKVSKLQYEQLLSEKEKVARENQRLQEAIDSKKSEIEENNATLLDLKKMMQRTEQEDDKLKDEIARLNKEIISLKSRQANQAAAYKDMALYFSEMKAKTAADILSRLDDEEIIGIFSQMESDAVAELMQNMDTDKAAQLSKKMLVAAP